MMPNMDEFYENKRRLKLLTLSIDEKHRYAQTNVANPVEEAGKQEVTANIAQLISNIPHDFLFPKEFKDAESDHEMRVYAYSDSPLAKAIAYADNETAMLLVNKPQTTPEHFVINNKVPSLEHAINTANEAIAALIFKKLDPKMQEKYKQDYVAAFGKSDVTEHVQTQPPALKEKGKKIS